MCLHEFRALVLVIGAVLIPQLALAGQTQSGAATPRAIDDSTYAVRITLDALVDEVRHGRLDPRRFNDPPLAAATSSASMLIQLWSECAMGTRCMWATSPLHPGRAMG